MPNTEQLVLEIIFEYGGEARVQKIARAARLSSDYVRMICQSLGRRDHIDYLASKGLCILKGRGAEIAKKAVSKRKDGKILTSGRSFSRTRGGKVVLDY